MAEPISTSLGRLAALAMHLPDVSGRTTTAVQKVFKSKTSLKICTFGHRGAALPARPDRQVNHATVKSRDVYFGNYCIH
jgi:hypothetical protein